MSILSSSESYWTEGRTLLQLDVGQREELLDKLLEAAAQLYIDDLGNFCIASDRSSSRAAVRAAGEATIKSWGEQHAWSQRRVRDLETSKSSLEKQLLELDDLWKGASDRATQASSEADALRLELGKERRNAAEACAKASLESMEADAKYVNEIDMLRSRLRSAELQTRSTAMAAAVATKYKQEDQEELLTKLTAKLTGEVQRLKDELAVATTNLEHLSSALADAEARCADMNELNLHLLEVQEACRFCRDRRSRAVAPPTMGTYASSSQEGRRDSACEIVSSTFCRLNGLPPQRPMERPQSADVVSNRNRQAYQFHPTLPVRPWTAGVKLNRHDGFSNMRKDLNSDPSRNCVSSCSTYASTGPGQCASVSPDMWWQGPPILPLAVERKRPSPSVYSASLDLPEGQVPCSNHTDKPVQSQPSERPSKFEVDTLSKVESSTTFIGERASEESGQPCLSPAVNSACQEAPPPAIDISTQPEGISIRPRPSGALSNETRLAQSLEAGCSALEMPCPPSQAPSFADACFSPVNIAAMQSERISALPATSEFDEETMLARSLQAGHSSIAAPSTLNPCPTVKSVALDAPMNEMLPTQFMQTGCPSDAQGKCETESPASPAPPHLLMQVGYPSRTQGNCEIVSSASPAPPQLLMQVGYPSGTQRNGDIESSAPPAPPQLLSGPPLGFVPPPVPPVPPPAPPGPPQRGKVWSQCPPSPAQQHSGTDEHAAKPRARPKSAVAFRFPVQGDADAGEVDKESSSFSDSDSELAAPTASANSGWAKMRALCRRSSTQDQLGEDEEKSPLWLMRRATAEAEKFGQMLAVQEGRNAVCDSKTALQINMERLLERRRQKAQRPDEAKVAVDRVHEIWEEVREKRHAHDKYLFDNYPPTPPEGLPPKLPPDDIMCGRYKRWWLPCAGKLPEPTRHKDRRSAWAIMNLAKSPDWREQR